MPSSYKVSEQAQYNKNKAYQKVVKSYSLLNFRDYFLKRMKHMLPSGFGFVEGSGFFYGLMLSARTLFPARVYKLSNRLKTKSEDYSEPEMKLYAPKAESLGIIPLEEKVNIVKSAFDLMGWKQFAPLVVFVGHGSHSANNPYSSSLDCGACAARPGRHNARTLAQLANLPEVRKALEIKHAIHIPDSTIFIGAEHNTTTDEISLFDAQVPSTHHKELSQLKLDLSKAQQSAALEKGINTKDAVLALQQKASDWSETRPEWGLAGNAGFIIGPRRLSKNSVLNGRCFLHSYDWEQDDSGKALEGIMQGPLVVTQWINNHYYFSAVDNDAFGGGSKITHNVTGKFGVVQGNGGDLKIGLPLQSIYQSDSELYHQPLRLSALIQAPIQRIEDILSRNTHIKSLLDNEWIYLMVMDPMEDNKIKRYKKSMHWEAVSGTKTEFQTNSEPNVSAPVGYN